MQHVMLLAHSWLRWALLILLLVALVQAYRGWMGNQSWTDGHKRLNLFTMIAVDIQLLLGLVLYMWPGSWGKMLLSQTKVVMKSRLMRFWAVEHIFMMVIAIVLIHIGFAKAKKIREDVKKHKTVALFFTFALLLILASIPWPFIPKIGRAWFLLK